GTKQNPPKRRAHVTFVVPRTRCLRHIVCHGASRIASRPATAAFLAAWHREAVLDEPRVGERKSHVQSESAGGFVDDLECRGEAAALKVCTLLLARRDIGLRHVVAVVPCM